MVLVARLPTQGGPGREIVRASLNGQPVRLIFDTGSFTSILTKAVADRLGLPLLSNGDFQSHIVPWQVSGIGGTRIAVGVTARSVELGGLHARNYHFLAADFSLGDADGLLSSDLISQFDVDLDAQEHQVQLFQPQGDCSAPAAFLEGPLYPVPLYRLGQDREPRIAVQIGGKDVIAEIDTGAAGTVIYRRAAERLGLKWQDLQGNPGVRGAGVGPNQVRGARVVLPSVAVGDLEFGQLPAVVLDQHSLGSDVDMLLGADFQSKVHLWISYSSKTLIIQYPRGRQKRPARSKALCPLPTGRNRDSARKSFGSFFQKRTFLIASQKPECTHPRPSATSHARRTQTVLAEPDMRRAVYARDPSADGAFFYAVLSTGVFCFPSCAARPALPENLRFFPTSEAARAAGYRPCQRCRPELPPRVVRERDAVAKACRAIDAGVFDPAHAAAAAGLSPRQLARAFRRIAGVTLAAYEQARRQRVVQAALGAGAGVTDTLYMAGFGSSGRFYEAAPGMLGMTPTAWRAGGAGEVLHHATGQSWLGPVLVAATARGICAILIGASEAALLEDLAARFPRARLAAADAALAAQVEAVVAMMAAPAAEHALPLDIAGTLFQLRVWTALRQIPAGTTVTYGALAAQLGAPKAARAVAAACAANRLAVAVPCHRVVGADGSLAGYRWGLERKRGVAGKRKEGLLF